MVENPTNALRVDFPTLIALICRVESPRVVRFFKRFACPFEWRTLRQ